MGSAAVEELQWVVEREARVMPQAFDENPVEAFRRNVYINAFYEDRHMDALIKAMGSDHVLFGSDFPHPEGLAETRTCADRLPSGLTDDQVASIMGGNLSRLMRVGENASA